MCVRSRDLREVLFLLSSFLSSSSCFAMKNLLVSADLEKENVCPSSAGFRAPATMASRTQRSAGRSPLPQGFPRAPLQDITHVLSPLAPLNVCSLSLSLQISVFSRILSVLSPILCVSFGFSHKTVRLSLSLSPHFFSSVIFSPLVARMCALMSLSVFSHMS